MLPNEFHPTARPSLLEIHTQTIEVFVAVYLLCRTKLYGYKKIRSDRACEGISKG